MSDKNTTDTNNDLLALSNIVGGLLASGQYTEHNEYMEYRAIMFSENVANEPSKVRFVPLAVMEGIDIFNRMKFHLKMEMETKTESAKEDRRFVFIGEKDSADQINTKPVTEWIELLVRFEGHLKTKGIEKGLPFLGEETYYALFEAWCRTDTES